MTVRQAQGRGRGLWLLPLAFLLPACGVKSFIPPAGPGTPFADYATAFEQATGACAGVKTISATLSLSGRAGNARLRGRVDAGFAASGQARLEGRAPFGRPAFILVARSDSSATLVLPRDNRVLRDAPAAAVVEALAGVALNPDELHWVVAGCGFGGPRAAAGRTYGDWLAVDANGTTHYLRRIDRRWRLMASARGPLILEYRDFTSQRPSTIRMRATSPAAAPRAQTDLTVKLSDVAINVPLGPEVFSVEIPAGADPLTLEELRRAGPLGAGSPR